jgi:phosphatidylinositol glycan class W
MSSTKELKEAFVTGHNGTTPAETLLVSISAPVGIFLYHETKHFLTTITSSTPSFPILLIIETLGILLPMAICQTKYLYPHGVMFLSCELACGLFLYFHRTKGTSSFRQPSPSKDGNVTTTKLEYLTFYRSTVSYLTFVAILAVDFQVFPRRFAKTETSGYGLMDLGAGSFCISGGFVSWYARRRYQPASTPLSKKEKTPRVVKLIKVVVKCLPLIIMGFIRFFTTKGLEYQEHVSEYGVHWNFFFTLSVVSVVSLIVRTSENATTTYGDQMIWILLLGVYQAVLSFGNVQGFIENGPRRWKENENGMMSGIVGVFINFFYANREGILGCLGYLGLYFCSEDIGQYCLWRCNDGPEGKLRQGKRLLQTTCIGWSVHYIFATILDIPVSRRSTNATFCLWTLSHNVTILFFSWLAFHLSANHSNSTRENPPIFAAVNRHGLIIFILANLMTGAVNLTINTLEASDGTALIVIICYLFSVGAVAILVDWILGRRSTNVEAKDM